MYSEPVCLTCSVSSGGGFGGVTVMCMANAADSMKGILNKVICQSKVETKDQDAKLPMSLSPGWQLNPKEHRVMAQHLQLEPKARESTPSLFTDQNCYFHFISCPGSSIYQRRRALNWKIAFF
jgi:hypothetical protein